SSSSIEEGGEEDEEKEVRGGRRKKAREQCYQSFNTNGGRNIMAPEGWSRDLPIAFKSSQPIDKLTQTYKHMWVRVYA
ncbi:hypothetical protein SK128_022333, partial [Halocaridina rubra]